MIRWLVVFKDEVAEPRGGGIWHAISMNMKVSEQSGHSARALHDAIQIDNPRCNMVAVTHRLPYSI
jgi:hypothetical protein